MMKQQRFYGAFCVGVAAAVVLTCCVSNSYAGNRPGMVRSKTIVPPQSIVPRAYLTLDSEALRQVGPLTPLAVSRHDHTMQTLARISVVGGVLLTADRLIRSMDSVKDTPLLLRDDGSSLRVSAVSNGFLLGFTVNRPLDF
jgi:hypothetical protein